MTDGPDTWMARESADAPVEPADEASVARVSTDTARYRQRERLLVMGVSVLAGSTLIVASPVLMAFGFFLSELPGTLIAPVTRILVLGV